MGGSGQLEPCGFNAVGLTDGPAASRRFFHLHDPFTKQSECIKLLLLTVKIRGHFSFSLIHDISLRLSETAGQVKIDIRWYAYKYV